MEYLLLRYQHQKGHVSNSFSKKKERLQMSFQDFFRANPRDEKPGHLQFFPPYLALLVFQVSPDN